MPRDLFGPLQHPYSIDFGAGRIDPLPELADLLGGLQRSVHPDGYLYPPRQHQVQYVWPRLHRYRIVRATRRLLLRVRAKFGALDPAVEDAALLGQVPKIVPQSTRPAFLWCLPATHSVTVDHSIDPEFRHGDGGFVIHLAGYLYGKRVQFQDWQFDGRVAYSHSAHAVYPTPSTAAHLFSKGFNTWRTFPMKKRRSFVTALYLHTKVPSYEWVWEQFMIEYMVFDALWKITGLSGAGHRDRIKTACSQFGLPFDEHVPGEIVNLRNNLVHEAVWEEQTPGFALTHHGWDRTHQLRALNQRLIPAILEVDLHMCDHGRIGTALAS